MAAIPAGSLTDARRAMGKDQFCDVLCTTYQESLPVLQILSLLPSVYLSTPH